MEIASSVKLTNGFLIGVPAHRKLFTQMIGESADIREATSPAAEKEAQRLGQEQRKAWSKDKMHLKSKAEQKKFSKSWETKVFKARYPNGFTATQKLGNLITVYARYGLDNQVLRKGGTLKRDDAKIIVGIDKVMSKAKLPIALQSFRLVGEQETKRLESLVGKTYLEKGYTSTTTSPAVLKKYIAKGGSSKMKDTFTVVKVVMPKGSKALPIAHLSTHPRDNEILVARNQKFKVTKTGKSLVLTVVV